MRAVLQSALVGAAVGVLVATLYLGVATNSDWWLPAGFGLALPLFYAADQIGKGKGKHDRDS